MTPSLSASASSEVLGRQVLVAHVGSSPIAGVEGLLQLTRQPHVGAVGLGQLGHGLVGGVAQGEGLLADPGEDRQHDAVFLAEQRGQEVVGGDLGVGVRARGLHGLR